MKAKALVLLATASTQGHDQHRLEQERAELLNELWVRLPRKPYLPPRLLRLTQHPAKLKAIDADTLIDAMRGVIGPKQGELSDKLLALTLVVARLGSTSSAMRIGLVAVEELRRQSAPSKRTGKRETVGKAPTLKTSAWPPADRVGDGKPRP